MTRMIYTALPVIAGCSASLSTTTRHDYDTMLGELRRTDQTRADASARVQALVAEHALDRCALIQASLAANPDLEAMRQAWRAAAAEVPARTALDDPMASYSLAPLSIGSSQVRFGQVIELQQKLPFPGKRGLAGDAAVDDAEAKRDDWRAARLALATAAADLHADAYLNARALEINAAHRALVEQMRKVAEARLASGRASTQDTLQAEVELDHLEHERMELEAQRTTIDAQIDALVHRDPTLPLPASAALPVPTEPESVAALVRRATNARPQRAAAQARLSAAETRVSLADRAYYPDFVVTGSYNSMWAMPQHRWMIGLGLDIPIERGKRGAELAAARAGAAESQAAIDSLDDAIAVDVVRTRSDLVEALHIAKLFDEKLVPAARAEVDAALAGFTNGTNDFPAVISAERELRTVQLGAERAHADAWRRQAALAAALGELPCGGAP